ncbi:Retrovirus-related Pol polyprotein from transposon [Dictyocoela muelleri]|nr:Retrovirus-related Pol polyprotein from transposon [Dictyocoela muelleri]
MQIKICGKIVEGIIDTGAFKSYISENLIKEINTPLTFTDSNETAQFANSVEQKISGRLQTEIEFLDLPHKLFKTNLTVLKNLGASIIIGTEFLEKFGVIINYKDLTITIDNVLCEIQNTKSLRWKENPDYILSNKILYKINEPPERVKKIIDKFKRDNPVLGNINIIKHGINTLDSNPISCKPYRIPYSLEKKVKEEINKLLELKIIRPSKSSFASLAFPIVKKTGNVRLVVYYRRLNKITVKEAYPFPNIIDQLNSIKKAKWYLQIDLNMGYYQIHMKEEDIHETTFVTTTSHYEFLRVPFGLSNAPRIFQRAMGYMFEGLDFVKVFLDDILIFSATTEKHEQNVEKVLEILQKNNASINFEKSNFFQKEVTYLGNIISSLGIRPDTSRVNGFRKELYPKNKKGIMKIIGYLNWFRPYIRNLISRISPITEKLKRGNLFSWNEEDKSIV